MMIHAGLDISCSSYFNHFLPVNASEQGRAQCHCLCGDGGEVSLVNMNVQRLDSIVLLSPESVSRISCEGAVLC